MYLYGSDCDVKVTIMWIKFEKKTKTVKSKTQKLRQRQKKIPYINENTKCLLTDKQHFINFHFPNTSIACRI